MTRQWLAALTAVGFVAMAGCAADEEPIEAVGRPATGALVKMDMSSQVAVLLDEIPAGPLREAAAAEAMAQSATFWKERAARQAKLTYYRLVFRGLYYYGQQNKGPLPLPPRQTWTITLGGPARRVTGSQHDMVVVDYAFGAHILAGLNDPGDVEPKLGTIGGTWAEAFNLPTDPELLLERTGYACMDEEEYPPGSVFEENVSYFYDDTCKAGSQWCHLTVQPQESCVEALQKHSGIVKTSMNFTRIAWDNRIADRVRVGTITNTTGADLSVVAEDIENEHRIVYKWFAPGSCEMEEGVISKLGWRRLLAFSATVRNDGAKMLHIGDVTDPASPWQQSNVYEFSACHGHYHFSHYGTFGYAGAPGSKRAFCLEDTNRFHNDESTPLRAIHQSCAYQGVTNGWGDEYEFGIPGQWVDITDVSTETPHDLTFSSNPDAFLCEGNPVTDSSGNLIFDPTSFLDSQGRTVSRMRCDKPATWNSNNFGSFPVASAGGSYVTEPCTRGQIGPLRNCGLVETQPLQDCTANSTVTLSCTAQGTPQVVRICEMSADLGVGVACATSDAKANVIVGTTATPVTFTCPRVRDGVGEGGYSFYSASVLPSKLGTVTCTGF